jgi:hypothetical protein
MSYNPVNPNGQATMANSSPVVIASDQTTKFVRGTPTSMTITNLNSLASSATAGWQSVRVDNTTTRANDYLVMVDLDMANTAPGSDRAVYVYLCAWYYDGTNWYAASGGTTTLPSGNQGTYTIASPNNLRLLGVLAYTTADMNVQDTFLLSNAFGDRMPDGWSLVIINFSGAAVAATGNAIYYTALNNTLA